MERRCCSGLLTEERPAGSGGGCDQATVCQTVETRLSNKDNDVYGKHSMKRGEQTLKSASINCGVYRSSAPTTTEVRLPWSLQEEQE
ncbi:hypothetical protein EYF80_052341 [Liparis tanakae]|uniref:Uncharacterized protein n=1 Tax=Liparis tanakae TaxID=230148 RepID=A0A4Z2F951_9TELE|nr:hypothetical protein EYF80_052341 [Liparis tanakae]